MSPHLSFNQKMGHGLHDNRFQYISTVTNTATMDMSLWCLWEQQSSGAGKKGPVTSPPSFLSIIRNQTYEILSVRQSHGERGLPYIYLSVFSSPLLTGNFTLRYIIPAR